MTTTAVTGRSGERLACKYLTAQGFRIVETNWRSPSGELDIIARDGRTLVFCEVKTRRSLEFGTPLEAVNEDKQRRIRRLAMQWIVAHRRPGFRWSGIRYDVVGILLRPGRPALIDYVPAAF